MVNELMTAVQSLAPQQRMTLIHLKEDPTYPHSDQDEKLQALLCEMYNYEELYQYLLVAELAYAKALELEHVLKRMHKLLGKMLNNADYIEPCGVDRLHSLLATATQLFNDKVQLES